MARTDGKPENQHYVPQMLLRNFSVPGRGKQDQIHVLDKRDDRGFRTGVQNIAAERRFYDLTDDSGVTASLEPTLTKLEEGASDALRKLLAARRLDGLSDHDRAWVALFLSWQKLRGTNFRKDQLHLESALREFIGNSGADPDALAGYSAFKSEDALKTFQFDFLVNSASDLAVHMLNKRWLLYETDAAHPFWISDNPVVLHNDEDFGPRGNIGLGVRGIQMYFPVAPTLLLGLLCFSLETQIRAAEEAHGAFCAGWRASAAYVPVVDEIILRHVGGSEHRQPLLRAIDDGVPVACAPENVTFLNSLQVLWAERYVFSSDRDFSLALQMTSQNPDARKGRRMTVA